jgi:5-formyltetrahydrofolate cyclo-ligase
VAKEHRELRSTPNRARHQAIAAGVVELLNELEPSGVVVLFDPLPGEMNVWAIKDSPSIDGLNISFALTRTPRVGHELTIHPADSELERHRFGYRQPVADSPLIPDSQVSAVLVPALAFDRTGTRIGFGAGYYDRLLARLPAALKIGIADLVVEGTLPADDFDIPMTHLATRDGILFVA